MNLVNIDLDKVSLKAVRYCSSPDYDLKVNLEFSDGTVFILPPFVQIFKCSDNNSIKDFNFDGLRKYGLNLYYSSQLKDIDINEQESFNDVFSVLSDYIYEAIEINDKLEVSFYISKNDLNHDRPIIQKAFDSFVSYMKLHLRQEERIYNVKATATDDYKHTFEIPKDSILYKLIINYRDNPPSKKSIDPTFAKGGIVNLDKDKIRNIVGIALDPPEQTISNVQLKKNA